MQNVEEEHVEGGPATANSSEGEAGHQVGWPVLNDEIKYLWNNQQ